MSRVLQPYKDWLIEHRSKIDPQIDDKLKIGACYYVVTEIKENGYIHIKLDSSILQFTKSTLIAIHIDMSDDIYVEIEYNLESEAIKFANYLDLYYPISHLYEAENYTLKDLYLKFKQNGK